MQEEFLFNFLLGSKCFKVEVIPQNVWSSLLPSYLGNRPREGDVFPQSHLATCGIGSGAFWLPGW